MWPFKKQEPESPRACPSAREKIPVEVEDLSVTFFLKDALEHPIRDFISYAGYRPSLSSREDGTFVYESEERLINFMWKWKETGYAVFNGSIVRFEHFDRASILRTKRVVMV